MSKSGTGILCELTMRCRAEGEHNQTDQEYWLPDYLRHSHYGTSMGLWKRHAYLGRPPPLPSKFNTQDASPLLGVSKGGIEIRYSGDFLSPVGSIRADHPIPPSCGLYYFEVHILCKGDDGYFQFLCVT